MSRPSGDARREAPEVTHLRALDRELAELVERAVLGDGTAARVRLLGAGTEAINEGLVRIEPMARASVRNMQPVFNFDPLDPAFELDERSRRRGLCMELITTPETVRRHPLLSSTDPTTLVGPLFTQALLVDDTLAVVGGPRDVDGAITAWTSTDERVVGLVRRIWREAAALARPVNPTGVPPLNARQLAVARRIALGDTDRAVARSLGVSLRTVERDASALLTLLGARNRAEAVLLMQGRGTPRS